MMGSKHHPMMNMMDMGDEDCCGEGQSPWEMCDNMMASFQEHVDATKFATPEIRQLFDEWVEQIEQEIVRFVETAGEVNAEKIAEHFKLSQESIVFLLTRLAQKGKIQFSPNDAAAT
jgi:hypothetical protein